MIVPCPAIYVHRMMIKGPICGYVFDDESGVKKEVIGFVCDTILIAKNVK